MCRSSSRGLLSSTRAVTPQSDVDPPVPLPFVVVLIVIRSHCANVETAAARRLSLSEKNLVEYFKRTRLVSKRFRAGEIQEHRCACFPDGILDQSFVWASCLAGCNQANREILSSSLHLGGPAQMSVSEHFSHKTI